MNWWSHHHRRGSGIFRSLLVQLEKFIKLYSQWSVLCWCISGEEVKMSWCVINLLQVLFAATTILITICFCNKALVANVVIKNCWSGKFPLAKYWMSIWKKRTTGPEIIWGLIKVRVIIGQLGVCFDKACPKLCGCVIRKLSKTGFQMVLQTMKHSMHQQKRDLLCCEHMLSSLPK